MSVTDDFPSGEELLMKEKSNQLRKAIRKLTLKLGGLPRIRKGVKEWNECWKSQREKRQKFEKERDQYRDRVQNDERLRDEAAGPPENNKDYVFETDGWQPTTLEIPVAIIHAWVPCELALTNYSEERLPLPVPDDELTLPEIYALSAAIFDKWMKGEKKINPWNNCPEIFDIEACKQHMKEGTPYWELCYHVGQLPIEDIEELLSLLSVLIDYHHDRSKTAMTDMPTDAQNEAKTAKRTRKMVKGQKKRKREPRITERQTEAYEAYQCEGSYEAGAEKLGISRQAFTDLLERRKINVDRIEAIMKADGKRSGRSIRPRQKLPEDDRGQFIPPADD